MQRQPTCNPPRCGLLGSLGHWLPVQQEPHPRHSRGKAGSTLRCSCAVPHHSTNRALGSLTSEVRRDLVHSTRSACWRPSPVAAASTWSHASCHRWPVAFSLGRGHGLFERPRRGPRSSSALPGERASTVSWLMSSGGVAPVASKRGTVVVFTQRSGEAARSFEAETGSPRWFDAGRGARACVPKRLRSRSARAEHQPCGAFPDSVLPLTVAPDFTCSVASLGWCSGPQLLGNCCLRNRSLADHMSWLGCPVMCHPGFCRT